jgi:hypothetical protein
MYRQLYGNQLEIYHRYAIVHGTGQGEAMHRKYEYKRLKLGGGQAYDRSAD